MCINGDFVTAHNIIYVFLVKMMDWVVVIVRLTKAHLFILTNTVAILINKAVTVTSWVLDGTLFEWQK